MIDPIKRKFHPPSESLRLSEMFVESPNTNSERLIPELFEKIVQKIVR